MPRSTAQSPTRPTITVVGLGPGGPELFGSNARRAIADAHSAYLRTRRHPAASELGAVASFDHHYEECATFEEVYASIVEDLVEAARRAEGERGEIVYAVPGSPLVAERTVQMLRADPRVAISVRPATSFVDLAWERLGVDPISAGVRLVDGTRFAEDAAGERGPLLVGQCWSAGVLSDIKLSIDHAPSAAHGSVTLLHHLGLPDERVVRVAWEDLDRSLEPDHLTSLWIERLASPVAGELSALVELVRTLRARCPWDREQTHASLTRHLLEESYEVIDAVSSLSTEEARRSPAGVLSPGEAASVAHLQEELGDLLFQVYFHARLAEEEGRFDLSDVARTVREKLVARHPHVFGDVEATSAQAVVHNWEVIKRAEKGRESVTDGIPRALPALALAAKLQRKADPIVGDRPSFDEQRERVVERVAAWREASAATASEPGAASATGEEVGAALLELVDLARRLGVEPEDALRNSAWRFAEHVRAAEQQGIDARGKSAQ